MTNDYDKGIVRMRKICNSIIGFYGMFKKCVDF